MLASSPSPLHGVRWGEVRSRLNVRRRPGTGLASVHVLRAHHAAFTTSSCRRQAHSPPRKPPALKPPTLKPPPLVVKPASSSQPKRRDQFNASATMDAASHNHPPKPRLRRARDPLTSIYDSIARVTAPSFESVVEQQSMEKLVQMNIRAALKRLQAKVAHAKYIFNTYAMEYSQITADLEHIKHERRMREHQQEQALSTKFIARLDKTLKSEKHFDEKPVTQRVAARGVTKPPVQRDNASYKALQQYILNLDISVYDSMSDIMLYDFRLLAIQRRMKNIDVLRQRRQAIDRFFKSIHHIDALVDKRASLYEKSQDLCLAASSGLCGVEHALTEVRKLNTKHAGYYARMAERLSKSTDQVSENAHWWRYYFKRRVMSDYADDSCAWDHSIIGFSFTDTIRNIKTNAVRISEDVDELLKTCKRLAMSYKPGSDKRREWQRLGKNMIMTARELRKFSLDCTPLMPIRHYGSLRDFYLSKHPDSIYFEQLRILYPFEVARLGLLRLRRHVQQFRHETWGMVQKFQPSGPGTPDDPSKKVDKSVIAPFFYFEAISMHVVKDFGRLNSSFIEFNWARLKLEQLFPELKSRKTFERPTSYSHLSPRAMFQLVVELHTGQLTLGEGHVIQRTRPTMMATGTSFVAAPSPPTSVAAPRSKKMPKKKKKKRAFLKDSTATKPANSIKKVSSPPKPRTVLYRATPAYFPGDKQTGENDQTASRPVLPAKEPKNRRRNERHKQKRLAALKASADKQSPAKGSLPQNPAPSEVSPVESIENSSSNSVGSSRHETDQTASMPIQPAKEPKNRRRNERHKQKRLAALKASADKQSPAKGSLPQNPAPSEVSPVKSTENSSSNNSIRHRRLGEKKTAIIHGTSGSADINNATKAPHGRASFHTSRHVFNPDSTSDMTPERPAQTRVTGSYHHYDAPSEYQNTSVEYQNAESDVTRNANRLEQAEQTPEAAAPAQEFWSMKSCTTPTGKPISVHYCSSLIAAEKICEYIMREIDEIVAVRSEAIIGFDLEWMVNATSRAPRTHQISLIQIALPTRVALIHIAAFFPNYRVEHLLPPTFARIMERKDVVKVGVAIKADCSRLYRVLGVETEGVLELSYLHRLAKYYGTEEEQTMAYTRRLISLSQQVEEHLGLPLNKDPMIRAGNWSKRLNYEQVQYAAADAYVGMKLYEVLEQKRLLLQPVCPPRPELLSVGQPKPKPARTLRPVCNPAGISSVETASEGSSSESEAFATPPPSRKTRTKKIATEEVVEEEVAIEEMAATES